MFQQVELKNKVGLKIFKNNSDRLATFCLWETVGVVGLEVIPQLQYWVNAFPKLDQNKCSDKLTAIGTEFEIGEQD